jgi:hypothetical protein
LERINQLPTIGKTFFDVGKDQVGMPCGKDEYREHSISCHAIDIF